VSVTVRYVYVLRGSAADSTRMPTVEHEYLLFSGSDSDIIEPESTAESHHCMIDILSVSSGPRPHPRSSCIHVPPFTSIISCALISHSQMGDMMHGA
jgi:hypothetical protein